MEEESKPVEGLDGVKSELGLSETSEDERPEHQDSSDESNPEQTEDNKGESEHKDDIDYEQKFKASTTENQRIRGENQSLQDDLEEERAKSKNLEETLREHLKQLEQDDPTSAEVIKMRSRLQGLERSNLLEKEARVVSEFIERNSQAKDDREALKSLMRANPKKSPEELWERYLKPAYDRGVNNASDTLRQQKTSKPETGKGSKTGEPTDEIPDGFNSWPLAKRKAWFKKKGING